MKNAAGMAGLKELVAVSVKFPAGAVWVPTAVQNARFWPPTESSQSIDLQEVKRFLARHPNREWLYFLGSEIHEAAGKQGFYDFVT